MRGMVGVGLSINKLIDMGKLIDYLPTILLIALGLFVGYGIGNIYNHQKEKSATVKAAIYESGYLDGSIAGGRLVATDSLSFSDWEEMKKQDSIKAIIEYKKL